MNAMRHRIQMIDDFEAWLFAEIVDACDVDQVIEGKFVAAKLRDRTKVTRCNRVSGFAAKFSFELKFCLECFGEAIKQFLSTHARFVTLLFLFFISLDSCISRNTSRS